MTSIYYELKKNKTNRTIDFIGYLNMAEVEYRTVYSVGRWTVLENYAASGFYSNNDNDAGFNGCGRNQCNGDIGGNSSRGERGD